jgi:hypothetical protein
MAIQRTGLILIFVSILGWSMNPKNALRNIRPLGESVARALSPLFIDAQGVQMPLRSVSPQVRDGVSPSMTSNLFIPIRSPLQVGSSSIPDTLVSAQTGSGMDFVRPRVQSVDYLVESDIGMRNGFETVDSPSLNDPASSKIVYEHLGNGAIGVIDFMARGRNSAVFGVLGREDLVIKYQVHCGSKLRLHPLINEFSILSRIKTLGISPKPLFISASAIMPLPRTYKTNFGMDDEERQRCHERQSQVRFMASERVGKSLYQLSEMFKPRKVPYPLATKLVIETLKNLRVLHEVGRIIHNDIHWGNVALPRQVVSEPQVFLMDFGRSVEISTSPRLGGWIPFSFAVVHSSPFEIAGDPPGPRDDVYRSLFMLLAMILGTDFMKYHQSLARTPKHAYDVKVSEHRLLEPLRTARFPENVVSGIGKAFATVLSVNDPLDAVRYEEIIDALRSTLPDPQRHRH